MHQQLPESYRDAEVRCVLPHCPVRGRMGLGIDIPGEPTVRVAINLEGARLIWLALGGYISSLAGNQSPGSPLMPSDPRSVPSDGVNT